MKIKLHLAVGLAAAIALSGCASTETDPLVITQNNALANATPAEIIEKTPEGKQELQSVRYIARHLMDYDDRKEYRQELLQQASEWEFEAPAFGLVGASLITDNPFSAQGQYAAAGFDAAFRVVNFIFDGAYDNIGQIWLPKEVNGQKIENENQAREVAVEITADAIEQTFDEMGYTFEHLGNLTHENFKNPFLIFEGKLKDESKFVEGKTPMYIQAIVISEGFKKIDSEDTIESLALGFKPSFMSEPNAHRVTIAAGRLTFENGEFITVELDNGVVFYQGKGEWNTIMSRQFYRGVSRQIPWVQGRNEYKTKFVTFKGETYGFSSNYRTLFIDKRIEG